jgi:hypothetical protein
MSDVERPDNKPNRKSGEDSQKGPSLILLYSLIALAMALAVGFALLILFPFSHHR